MSYRNLRNFQNIFNRADFNYISDNKNINDISNIILHRISVPDGRESAHVRLLEKFLKNLDSFYKSISGNNPNFNKGYSVIQRELTRCINLFSERESERRSISRGYCKKFSKTFLHGLSKLLDGIRAAFDPDIISKTNIDRDQFVRYILNNVEGLRKRFLFNKRGRHAFVNKIPLLNIQELIVTERLLLRPSAGQIRIFHDWKDLGLGHAPIRLLVKPGRLGKKKVYFLYKANEHNAYENQLATPPSEVAFSPL